MELRVVAALPVSVRRRRSRRVSDLREGILRVAAGRRAWACPGHQLLRVAAGRRIRAAGGCLACHDRGVAQSRSSFLASSASSGPPRGTRGFETRPTSTAAFLMASASNLIRRGALEPRVRAVAARRANADALGRTCGSRWGSTSPRTSLSSSVSRGCSLTFSEPINSKPCRRDCSPRLPLVGGAIGNWVGGCDRRSVCIDAAAGASLAAVPGDGGICALRGRTPGEPRLPTVRAGGVVPDALRSSAPT